MGKPPKSSILIGFSIVNQCKPSFWGTPIVGNTHMFFFFKPVLSVTLFLCRSFRAWGIKSTGSSMRMQGRVQGWLYMHLYNPIYSYTHIHAWFTLMCKNPSWAQANAGASARGPIHIKINKDFRMYIHIYIYYVLIFSCILHVHTTLIIT